MSDDKIGSYKNDAGYTTDTHAQTGKITSKTHPAHSGSSEDSKKPPEDIENWHGLCAHNQRQLVLGVKNNIVKTQERFKDAELEPPEELENALNEVEEYL